mmetsp:Transcript_23845/g.94565  ORF Transcript_23845/g.94565 Transcript_23845/m.94565 type:complete len:130 (+) Transcript_23845:1119-1508(+)
MDTSKLTMADSLARERGTDTEKHGDNGNKVFPQRHIQGGIASEGRGARVATKEAAAADDDDATEMVVQDTRRCRHKMKRRYSKEEVICTRQRHGRGGAKGWYFKGTNGTTKKPTKGSTRRLTTRASCSC